VHGGGGGPGARAGRRGGRRRAALRGEAREAAEEREGEAEGEGRGKRRRQRRQWWRWRDGRGRLVHSGDTVRRRGLVGGLRCGAAPGGERAPPRRCREAAQRGMLCFSLFQLSMLNA